MKAQPYPIPLAILIVPIFFWSCNSSINRPYDILTLEGVEWAGNVSTSYPFGSFMYSEEIMEAKLAASPGDLLFLYDENEEEDAIYIQYMAEDPSVMHYKADDERIYLNDGLAGIILDSASSNWEYLKTLDVDQVGQLRFLFIKGYIGDEQIKILEKFSGNYGDIGLLTDISDYNLDAFSQILHILRPDWMIFECSQAVNLNEETAGNLAHLEVLFTDMTSIQNSNILNYCSNLEQLIMTEYTQGQNALLPLASMNSLESLTMIESEITDLASFEFPSSLTRLHFSSCYIVNGMSGIQKISNLQSLSLSGCNEMMDISSLAALPKLQFLGLPQNITQEEFDHVLKDQNALEVLEIIECDSILDYTALNKMNHLKALTIIQETIDLTQLHSLNDPELLLLSIDSFDSTDLESLKAALPETDIYPGGGMCLGSGWLLLLIPFLLILRYRDYMMRKMKNDLD